MGEGDATKAGILRSIRFSGRSAGRVKSLSAFKKSHHSVPDAVNPATQGFLAKLAAPELAEEGERFFQSARSLFGYKRKDLALELGSGSAVLSARDFVLEVTYALEETDPADYVVVRALHSLRNPEFIGLPETDQLFPNLFDRVVFLLSRGAPVERVIDAVEGLPSSSGGLRVDYPSDYSQCTLSVPQVEAEVLFDGGELAIVFPRTGTPRALWESFLVVRDAFALTKDATLRELLKG